MKLLIDHNISFRIAHALNALFPEHEIVALRDRFPEIRRTLIGSKDWTSKELGQFSRAISESARARKSAQRWMRAASSSSSSPELGENTTWPRQLLV